MKTSVEKCMGEGCICHVVKRRKALKGMTLQQAGVSVSILNYGSIPPPAAGSMILLAAERERMMARRRAMEGL